jgi:hypothetical protein
MIAVVSVDALEPRDLFAIRSRLTKPESEFQREVAGVLEGESSSCTPIAVCHIDGALVGWACSHIWNDTQTLEMFVDPRHRASCIALALSAALVIHGVIDRNKSLAVFAPATGAIARKLGVLNVVEYERSGAGWVKV